MDGKTNALITRLNVKKRQMQNFMAKKHGMGSLTDLSAATYQCVQTLTDQILKGWEQANRKGDPDTLRDDTFNKLAREIHDLQKQLDACSSS